MSPSLTGYVFYKNSWSSIRAYIRVHPSVRRTVNFIRKYMIIKSLFLGQSLVSELRSVAKLVSCCCIVLAGKSLSVAKRAC